jgi:protease-4
MQFLKNVLATIVGLFLFCFLFFFLFLIIALAAGGNNEDVVQVKENSVIELDITEVTDDYGGDFVYTDFSMFNEEPKDGLTDVLNAIDAAKKDDKIKGITITNSSFKAGHGTKQSP